MLNGLGGAGTFAVFGALAVAGFLFVHRYPPETKGHQLEDICHYWENGGRWPEQSAPVTTPVATPVTAGVTAGAAQAAA